MDKNHLNSFSRGPRYANDQNHLNNFGRGPPKDHLCEITSKLDLGFRRSCHLSQLLTDRLQVAAEDQPQNTPCHYLTGELKIGKTRNYQFEP